MPSRGRGQWPGVLAEDGHPVGAWLRFLSERPDNGFADARHRSPLLKRPRVAGLLGERLQVKDDRL
jgi:hypothetical protein